MDAHKPIDIHGKPYNRNLLVIVLMVGSFCTVLNGTLLATAFPAIMKSFDIDTSTVQWLTTGFMLVNGIMIPVSAFLINKLGSRIMYIGAMATFLLGTVICYFSGSFAMLLCGRLIQGLGVGVSMPLLQTIMLTIFPPEKRGTAMGTVGLVIGLAPALGPTLSGWIVDTFTWRDLFGLIIPIVLAVLIFAFFCMKSVLNTTNPHLDLFSLITSTAGFGIMLYGFSEAGSKGWGDGVVLGCLIVGTLIVIVFGMRQLKMQAPFLDISVFKYAEFSLAAVLSGISNLAMVGVEMILPMYIQNIRGETAFHSGLMLLPGALVLGVMSPITGRLFDRYGAKYMAMTGTTLLTLGTLPFLFITQNTSLLLIIIFYAVRIFGVSMTMMPVTTSGMNALPFDKITHGTAVNNTFRQVLSSIGTAILTSVLTNVTLNSMPSKSLLHSQPLTYQNHALDAAVSGYHAAFMVSVGFAFVSLLLTFRLNNGTNVRKPSGDLGGNH